jgi:hypothetical protein
MNMVPVIAKDVGKRLIRSEQLDGYRSRYFAMDQKRWFLHPVGTCAMRVLFMQEELVLNP